MEDNTSIENVEFNENEIVVEDLNSYLEHISIMRKAIKDEEGQDSDSQKFYFRGQANCNWDVVPGIFRENYLSYESELINGAYLRNPSEFRQLDTDFEKLAKLQHYGLPTRLLDVTSNPLVALYFACQPYQEYNNEENTIIEPDGIVLFSRTYGKSCNDLEVSVISHLANMEINGDTTLNKLLEELEDKRVYSTKTAKDCRDGQFKSLIKILQNNYFVVSNMNNERLIRQSGLFLLVGKYNVILKEKDVGQSVIQVAKSSVKSDFDKTVFRIPFDKKDEILKELDFYNINEGALFPELEHQMTYVKNFKSSKTYLETGSFAKVDTEYKSEEDKSPVEQKELTEKETVEIIENALTGVNKLLRDECKLAILENMSVDWYRRETVLSKMRIALTEVLCKYQTDRVASKITATSIVNKIVSEICSVK
ncbi:MAG: FRG domain-containing protein [Clostridia bacterium]|nr:FRG domain-containing protein [Clostridia bacterium]